MRQIALLNSRRFRGLFWSQFLGAFNDNFYKNALTILVVYRGIQVGMLSPVQVTLVAAALFILPYFLFSATAGQLADKYEKSVLVRWIKVAEVALALFAVVALTTAEPILMLLVLFGLGLQSTFFGPVKYSILPQILEEEELVGGNALVEGGTTLAILLGTILAGILVSFKGPLALGSFELPMEGTWLVSFGCVAIAVAGYQAARQVPIAPAQDPTLKVQWNPIPPTIETFRITVQNRTVFLSILGISWFWLFGQGFLALFPDYAKNTLYADEHVVTMMLALFSVGVGVGSLLCDRFSYERLELGLVPFGSLGMTLFAFDLFVVGSPFPKPLPGLPLLTPWGLLASPDGLRILADLFLLAMFSGFFIVPLYTLIQQWTDPRHRSRVIAGNNVLNAFFMVASVGLLMSLIGNGFTVPEIFGILAILNGVVAVYIYTLIPEFFLRFLAYLLAHGVYHLKVRGLENIPKEGPVLLACNHVSYADWLVISATVKRPIRFVMWHTYARIPLLRFLLKDARVIPIGSRKQNPEQVERAFQQMAEELEQGNVIGLFPEGQITRDGELARFRSGIEEISRRTGVPVVPMALRGLWGSLYSRKEGRFMKRLLRPLRSRVELVIGAPIPADEVTVDRVRAEVAELRGDKP